MKKKLTLMAAALALVSTAALADNGGGPLDLSGGTAFFGRTPTGVFTDIWTFSLAGPSFRTYFSDRGRPFQADRGRRNIAVGDALGKRASTGLNVSQSSTISLKHAVMGVAARPLRLGLIDL
jgi:hypothetical protein